MAQLIAHMGISFSRAVEQLYGCVVVFCLSV